MIDYRERGYKTGGAGGGGGVKFYPEKLDYGTLTR